MAMRIPPKDVLLRQEGQEVKQKIDDSTIARILNFETKPDEIKIDWTSYTNRSSSESDEVDKQLEELLSDQDLEELLTGQDLDEITDHAWLVVLGLFAQSLGLIEKLEEVSLNQKQGENGKPQSKLIEFLVGILGGIEQLNELNLGDHPIVLDEALVEAWGQEIFSHYSQVSRTLAASDEMTLTDIIDVIREISDPFIQTAIVETLKQSGELVVDVDLTGRDVSPTSESYENADFGWMDDGVKKGYQAAVTSLVCEKWGRLMLTLERYSGRTLSADCLQSAVKEVEVVLKVRPRRRVELVEKRRSEQQAKVAQMEAEEMKYTEREEKAIAAIDEANQRVQTAQAEFDRLSEEYQRLGRDTKKPHSKLGKSERRLKSAKRKVAKTERDRDKVQRLRRKHQQKMMFEYADLNNLDEQIAVLEADNAANPNPVSITLRIDAGFSHGENLAWLIEMGYTVLTKAFHNSSCQALLKQLPDQPEWTTVGKNAEAIDMGNYTQNNCPYPLRALLIRYHLPKEVKHTIIFYHGDNPPPEPKAWFQQYNKRQTIEAGIKETKGVFTLKRHLVRSPFGMQIQEQFALLAANLTRWAADWVKQQLVQSNSNFDNALGKVKTLAKTVSRSTARWLRNSSSSLLIFEENSPFYGAVISFKKTFAYQRPLPLFNFNPL